MLHLSRTTHPSHTTVPSFVRPSSTGPTSSVPQISRRGRRPYTTRKTSEEDEDEDEEEEEEEEDEEEEFIQRTELLTTVPSAAEFKFYKCLACSISSSSSSSSLHLRASACGGAFSLVTVRPAGSVGAHWKCKRDHTRVYCMCSLLLYACLDCLTTAAVLVRLLHT
jgi:hypothetical protein